MDLEKMLEEAVKKALPQLATEDVVTKASVQTAIESLKTELKGEIASIVAAEVAKALPADREGVGRKGTVESGPSIEDDPAAYLAKKAQAVRSGEATDYSAEEKALASELFLAFVAQGMKE